MQQRLELITLRLNNIDLGSVGDLLSSLVVLSELEHLQLIRCENTGPFLASITKLQLSLSSFYLDEEECYLNEDKDAVGEIILSLKAPKRITVTLCFEQDARSNLASTELHSAAQHLECLRIHHGDMSASLTREHGVPKELPSDNFRTFCHLAQSLRQLAFDVPTD